MGWMAKNRLSKNSVMLLGTELARNGDKKRFRAQKMGKEKIIIEI
jgi:hypothetical protein